MNKKNTASTNKSHPGTANSYASFYVLLLLKKTMGSRGAGLGIEGVLKI